MMKRKGSRILAGFLVLVMIIGLVPANLRTNASETAIESYTCSLTDGSSVLDIDDVQITLTKKDDNTQTQTVSTVDGIATFENFVEEETTYIVTVDDIFGYEAVEDTEVTIALGETSTNIVIDAIEGITVSGIVTDENGVAYVGATITITGYIDEEVVTDENGAYSFETYKGKENVITITAKEEKYSSILVTATYNEDVTVDHQFEVKKYNITTTADANGIITETEDNVLFGSDRDILITANEGYRIHEVTVNGEVIIEAADLKNYTVTLEDIQENYTVVATFYRMTYKITFTIGADGEVIYDDDYTIDGNGDVVYEDTYTLEGGSVSIEKIFEESTDAENPTTVAIKAIPTEGYRVSKVTVDGVLNEYEINSYIFEDILEMTGDHTIVIEFAINQYVLTVDCNENGSVSWGTEGEDILVNYGESATLNIIPNDGYGVESITVNGMDVEAEENEQGIFINFANIEEELNVEVTFVEIHETEVNENERLENDYYKIVFNEEDKVKEAYMDGDTYVIVFSKNATVTIEPKDPYNEILINSNKSYGEYSSEVQYSDTITIENVFVKQGTYADDKKNVAVNVKIIIDKTAPEVADIDDPGWIKENNITIEGTVSDATDSSGLDYVVWSANQELTEIEVLSSIENKVNIVDGTYSFTSEDGEQNQIYYIYAVDFAGNVSEPKTVNIKIDQTVPTITEFVFSTDENKVVEDLIYFATLGTFCKEKIYLTVVATDAGSGVVAISLCCDGQVYLTEQAVNNKVVFEISNEDFGSGVEISAIASDEVGNNSALTKPTDENVETSAQSNKVQITSQKASITITPEGEFYVDKAENEGEKDKLWCNNHVNFEVKIEELITGIAWDGTNASVVIEINGDSVDIEPTDQVFSENNEMLVGLTYMVNTSQGSSEGSLVEGLNTIKVTVTNSVGVVTSEVAQVYIDVTEATITEYEIERLNDSVIDKVINFLTFGIFCNEQVKITVTAEDSLSGVYDITLLLDGKEYAAQEIDEENKATFVVTQEAFEENFKYVTDISAVATDNVGNTTVEPVIPTNENSNVNDSTLILETIKPVITIIPEEAVFTGVTNTEDEQLWYTDNEIAVHVSVSDGNKDNNDAGLYSVVIKINDETVVSEKYYSEIYETEFTVYTNANGVDEATEYTIDVYVTDNAGNVSHASEKVYVDEDEPYITRFDFETSDDENKETSLTVEKTDYGFYFKEDTWVKIIANDNSSGVFSITYYMEDYNGVKTEEITESATDGYIRVLIPAGFKGQIYAKVTDNVGIALSEFVTPNSVIVETQEQHDQDIHIIFDVPEAEYTTKENQDLYSEDVEVEITIVDMYSGIYSIEWEVVAPYDTAKNQSETVEVENDGKVVEVKNDETRVEDTDWQIDKEDVNLVTEMHRTIIVANNSNDIIVQVTMTDRAGNTSTEEITFSIDKTAPMITVEYDNTTSDSAYNNIFKDNRKAVVTIYERNFDASDIMYAITNTDGVIPEMSDWEEHKNTDNPDETYYTATVEYVADGDYTFDISYVDRAGNTAEAFTQHAFTIDKVDPVVTVVYDNNSSMNGNYYNADRTATITITEHNFDASRVSIIGVATDNGEAAVFPTVTTWTNSGNDTYTATISYTADAKYSFDIEFVDKAGNSIADYATEEFYVDKTAPNVEISGVGDQTANNGDVIPVITYTDTNFDKDGVSILLSGANNGEVNYSGTFTDISNGQIFAYANFEKSKEVDDIYTLSVLLTDLAGNETTMKISFSVNRFGSVYDLSQVEGIVGQYLQDEQDIVIVETNADALDPEKFVIKLTKNGTPTTLVYGTDYTVEETGGDGQWYVYTFTISKTLFADDGTYNIAIYSVDAAGNVNENIDEEKSAEISFGIDKTAPIIVPIDLENGAQYPVDEKTVSIEIKDNLVLENVVIYLNGEEVDYTVNGETYTITIQKSNNIQEVKVVATDAAGNEYELTVGEFLVSTSVLIRWYNNTPLFVGSIVGAGVLILGLVTFFIFGKKNKK